MITFLRDEYESSSDKSATIYKFISVTAYIFEFLCCEPISISVFTAVERKLF